MFYLSSCFTTYVDKSCFITHKIISGCVFLTVLFWLGASNIFMLCYLQKYSTAKIKLG